MTETTREPAYTTRLLTPDTWPDFAALVEANNGVWGGCWCMGFHPEGVGHGTTAAQNREAKQAHVRGRHRAPGARLRRRRLRRLVPVRPARRGRVDQEPQGLRRRR